MAVPLPVQRGAQNSLSRQCLTSDQCRRCDHNGMIDDFVQEGYGRKSTVSAFGIYSFVHNADWNFEAMIWVVSEAVRSCQMRRRYPMVNSHWRMTPSVRAR